jgi:hypothetical protein
MQPSEDYDRRKIRAGLAIVTVVVLAALILMAVIDSGLGRAVMFAIAVTAFVRAFLLARSLRRGREV